MKHFGWDEVSLHGGMESLGNPQSSVAQTPVVHGVPCQHRQGFGVPVGDVLAVGGCSGIASGSLAEVNVKGQFIFQMQSRNLSVI